MWYLDIVFVEFDFNDGVKYIGLWIYCVEGDEVEFMVSMKGLDGQFYNMCECSCFVQFDGCWVYLDVVEQMEFFFWFMCIGGMIQCFDNMMLDNVNFKCQ